MRRAPWATSTVVIAHVLVGIDHNVLLSSAGHIFIYEDDNPSPPADSSNERAGKKEDWNLTEAIHAQAKTLKCHDKTTTITKSKTKETATKTTST